MEIVKCGLLSDEELSACMAISANEELITDVTSPAWSTALKVALNLLPVGLVFM